MISIKTHKVVYTCEQKWEPHVGAACGGSMWEQQQCTRGSTCGSSSGRAMALATAERAVAHMHSAVKRSTPLATAGYIQRVQVLAGGT
jgi:hypothetical protein